MKFVVMLLVLFVRRLNLVWPEWLAKRSWRARLDLWQQRFEQSAALPRWLFSVLLPALLVMLVFYVLSNILWGLPAWVAGFFLLLWLWGTESESNQLDALLAYGRLQDWPAVDQLVDASVLQEAADKDYRLDQRVLVVGTETLFASIFWLILLGYWACFFYLVNRLYLLHNQHKGEEEVAIAQALHDVLMFPVARLLVVCMALVADYQAVMQAVKGQWWSASNEGLLLTASQAINSEATSDEDADVLLRLEKMHGVLMRAMALWLVIAAIWVLLVV